MNQGRWDFYTQIIEMCSTARKHSAEFAAAHLEDIGAKQEAAMVAFHLRQVEKHAHNLAGERPAVSPETAEVDDAG